MKRLASRQHPENHLEDPSGGREVCTEGNEVSVNKTGFGAEQAVT